MYQRADQAFGGLNTINRQHSGQKRDASAVNFRMLAVTQVALLKAPLRGVVQSVIDMQC